ncbi:MAG: CTP synthase [Lachnospiraceae bacterium]|jgi:CTP synthase|nr:CTP synthase [Lachnospiraceae bacterium]
MIKYVFVTGGVVSGLGKGITAASLGRLLKARGYRVTMQKFDPYINVDPGTMNPIQHGEVFVTDDGTETDLDLGHYERFIDESLDHNANVTSGKIYWSVLNKERHGDYGGGTVQVIPHITNEIKSRFYRSEDPKEDRIAIIEVGGTVGDIESQPFLEAIRQFQHDIGKENAIMIHVTLIPYLRVSQEMKTKPTQMSVKKCLEIGIQPDILVCRTEYPLPQSMKDKIALFCNVQSDHVIQNLDAPSLYSVPLLMEKENLAGAVLECLNLPNPEPTGLKEWEEMVDREHHPKQETEIAIVGKYITLHDAYLSVVEALAHGGIATQTKVHIRWVDSEEVEKQGADALLNGVSGILVPGGFGNRGTEGMIMAASYAREKKIPYLGICLGMQMAVVAFARDILGYHDANSTEFAPDTLHPVIDLMASQKDVTNLGGTMRLGAYPCVLDKDSLSYRLYGSTDISERHRHRYEFNNDYRDIMNQKGLCTVGLSPDERIVEMVEYKDHPFYIGTQAHPEFKSRPNKAHPLFRGLVQAAVDYQNQKD